MATGSLALRPRHSDATVASLRSSRMSTASILCNAEEGSFWTAPWAFQPPAQALRSAGAHKRPQSAESGRRQVSSLRPVRLIKLLLALAVLLQLPCRFHILWESREHGLELVLGLVAETVLEGRGPRRGARR